MTSPAVVQAVAVRALIGLTILTVAAIGFAAYAAGLRAGRRR